MTEDVVELPFVYHLLEGWRHSLYIYMWKYRESNLFLIHEIPYLDIN